LSFYTDLLGSGDFAAEVIYPEGAATCGAWKTLALRLCPPGGRHDDMVSDVRRDIERRQYKSDVTDATAAVRMQRYRERKHNARNGADSNEHNGDGPRTIDRKMPDQAAVTDGGGRLIEVTDEQALAAWDAYGRTTTGNAFPRNRRGGWCFPTKWPPGHQAEVRPIGRTA
jgi:hypothetical protein